MVLVTEGCPSGRPLEELMQTPHAHLHWPHVRDILSDGSGQSVIVMQCLYLYGLPVPSRHSLLYSSSLSTVRWHPLGRVASSFPVISACDNSESTNSCSCCCIVFSLATICRTQVKVLPGKIEPIARIGKLWRRSSTSSSRPNCSIGSFEEARSSRSLRSLPAAWARRPLFPAESAQNSCALVEKRGSLEWILAG